MDHARFPPSLEIGGFFFPFYVGVNCKSSGHRRSVERTAAVPGWPGLSPVSLPGTASASLSGRREEQAAGGPVISQVAVVAARAGPCFETPLPAGDAFHVGSRNGHLDALQMGWFAAAKKRVLAAVCVAVEI